MYAVVVVAVAVVVWLFSFNCCLLSDRTRKFTFDHRQQWPQIKYKYKHTHMVDGEPNSSRSNAFNARCRLFHYNPHDFGSANVLLPTSSMLLDILFYFGLFPSQSYSNFACAVVFCLCSFNALSRFFYHSNKTIIKKAQDKGDSAHIR